MPVQSVSSREQGNRYGVEERIRPNFSNAIEKLGPRYTRVRSFACLRRGGPFAGSAWTQRAARCRVNLRLDRSAGRTDVLRAGGRHWPARGLWGMTIRVRCPVCGYRIKAPDGSFGRRGACPKCKLMIRMPSQAEWAARATEGAGGSSGEASPTRADDSDSGRPLGSADFEQAGDSAVELDPPGA